VSSARYPPELIEALRALEGLLPLQDDLDAMLTKLSHVAVSIVEGCDSASVTLIEAEVPRTVGATDEIAIRLDEAQYRSGSGPCLEAIQRAKKLVVHSLEAEERWPEFRESALEHGFMSSLSVPLNSNGFSVGLNLYGRLESGFKDSPRELTDLLASRASIAIENARIYGAAKQLIEQLNEAIKTREVIGEAKGILMAREAISEDEAFQMLATISQNSHIKLREVAQRMVDDAVEP
jgi:GAF domain-containing protein